MSKQTLQLGENSTEFESLNEDEVRSIVGDTLDDRLSKLKLPETFDSDSFKKDILGEVTNLFEKHKTIPTDEDALVKRLEKSLDSKFSNMLKGLSNGGSKEREPGWLSKLLSAD